MSTIVDQAIHRRQCRNPQSAGSRRPNAKRSIGTFGPGHRQVAFVTVQKWRRWDRACLMGSPASRRGYTMALGLDLDYLERSARGEFDLGWLRDTDSEWGVRAKPGKTGLTLRDIAIGSYGEVPEPRSSADDGPPGFRHRSRR